ncbi:hypothetical protein [Actinoplanes sp. NPDC049802]|uniref:hypothetical protein n=1 Tax=Actinoplanes sp. NPDC049802 TaxID=3154742 RepID=UPI0033EC9A3C
MPGRPERVSVTVTGISAPVLSHRSPALFSTAAGRVMSRSAGSTLITNAPSTSLIVAVTDFDALPPCGALATLTVTGSLTAFTVSPS